MRTFTLTLALLLTSALALAQGTYTQIDVPGALVTQATAINSAGDIAGLYVDSAGGHGFLLKHGSFTTIDYPGAQYSYLYGMNDKGQFVGVAEPNGFLYDIATQSFTSIDFPGANFTFPQAINNAGAISGFFQHQKGNNFVTYGFTFAHAIYRQVALPAASFTMAYGISASGDAVGFTAVGGSVYNFLERKGKFLPLGVSVRPAAQVYGINPQETAYVGSYEPETGLTGFLYNDSGLTPLLVPGSISTVATGVNSTNQVVGYFLDANFEAHGFLWTPPAASR